MADSRTRLSSYHDLYSDALLTDPYDAYAELRAIGGVVWLPQYELWALPRYATARAALIDWQQFSSAQGVGIAHEVNQFFIGGILASDPPLHNGLRAALTEQLSPKAIRALGPMIAGRADALVETLVEQGSFDAVTELAQPFPLGIVADLIGLPQAGRETLLARADAGFNTFGPMNDRSRASLKVFDETRAYATTEAAREHLTDGSWGRALYDAADRGDIRHDQILSLLQAFLFAGMDTTVNAVAHTLWLFGQHPDQWEALRADPTRAQAAFEEVVRYETPVQGFTRTISQEVELDGVAMAAGERVLVLYGSANRDDAKYADAAAFDFRRNPFDHIGFGVGIHHCAGQGLARLEGKAVLDALIRRIETFEIGTPTRHLNNAVRGLGHLPVTVTRAA